ncbi:hypothetical protein MAR_032258, partial [Mya arenaria]
SARQSASSKNKQNSNTTFLGNIYEDENKHNHIKRKSTQQSVAGSLPSAKKLIPIQKKTSTHVVTASEIETDLEIDDESTGAALNNTSQDDQTYYNELGSSTCKSKIPISQLVIYVDGKTHEAFRTEFEKFSSGLSKPYVESQKKENISKNRYKGIY